MSFMPLRSVAIGRAGRRARRDAPAIEQFRPLRTTLVKNWLRRLQASVPSVRIAGIGPLASVGARATRNAAIVTLFLVAGFGLGWLLAVAGI